MRSARAVRGVMLGAMLAGIITGCGGGSGGSSGGAGPAEQLAIGQVGQILRIYQKGKKPPPKGVKELLVMETGYPAAISSIRNQDVLVYWNVGFGEGADASSTVLAYQKDVPEKGGEVLMQDGTPRTMTAEEFKAARKPEGASTDPGTKPSAKGR